MTETETTWERRREAEHQRQLDLDEAFDTWIEALISERLADMTPEQQLDCLIDELRCTMAADPVLRLRFELELEAQHNPVSEETHE